MLTKPSYLSGELMIRALLHGSQVGDTGSPELPSYVEILAQDGAFFLLRVDADGHSIADTWHETELEAKQQAEFEFGAALGAWFEFE